MLVTLTAIFAAAAMRDLTTEIRASPGACVRGNEKGRDASHVAPSFTAAACPVRTHQKFTLTPMNTVMPA